MPSQTNIRCCQRRNHPLTKCTEYDTLEYRGNLLISFTFAVADDGEHSALAAIYQLIYLLIYLLISGGDLLLQVVQEALDGRHPFVQVADLEKDGEEGNVQFLQRWLKERATCWK